LSCLSGLLGLLSANIKGKYIKELKSQLSTSPFIDSCHLSKSTSNGNINLESETPRTNPDNKDIIINGKASSKPCLKSERCNNPKSDITAVKQRILITFTVTNIDQPPCSYTLQPIYINKTTRTMEVRKFILLLITCR